MQIYTSFPTANVIPGVSGTMVTATGALARLSVNMDAFPESGAVASVSGPYGGPWLTDPVALWNGGAGGFVGGAVAGTFDYSINLTWFFGDSTKGESRTIDMEYQFGIVPVPPTRLAARFRPVRPGGSAL